MPRWVNRDARAREIHQAAVRLILRSGYSDLSLRSLADELGGSISLVTHYFPTYSDLISSVLEYQLDEFDAELQRLETGEGPRRRLEILIDWFLPNDEETRAEERSRLWLLSQVPRDTAWVRPYLDRLEERMTQIIRDHLRTLVPDDRLDVAEDVLRLTINGIALSATEHPESWDADTQAETMKAILGALPLGVGTVASSA